MTSYSTEKRLIDLLRLVDRKKINADELDSFIRSNDESPVPAISPNELTIQEKAEDLAYEALIQIEQRGSNSKNMNVYMSMGLKALKLDKYCLPAYEVCGSSAIGQAARDKYLLQGAHAGEKIFGGAFEKKHSGKFMQFVATRPFLRLLTYKAETMRENKMYDKVIRILERLMRLDATDSMFHRYQLQSLYLLSGDLDQFQQICLIEKKFDSVHKLFNQALFLFMTEGPSRNADEAMKKAIGFNPHVIDYLTGSRPLPERHEPEYVQNENSGAIAYCQYALPAWQAQAGHGVLNWLMKFVPAPKGFWSDDQNSVGADISGAKIHPRPEHR
jgi:hypothetical protein